MKVEVERPDLFSFFLPGHRQNYLKDKKALFRVKTPVSTHDGQLDRFSKISFSGLDLPGEDCLLFFWQQTWPEAWCAWPRAL